MTASDIASRLNPPKGRQEVPSAFVQQYSNALRENRRPIPEPPLLQSDKRAKKLCSCEPRTDNLNGPYEYSDDIPHYRSTLHLHEDPCCDYNQDARSSADPGGLGPSSIRAKYIAHPDFGADIWDGDDPRAMAAVNLASIRSAASSDMRSNGYGEVAARHKHIPGIDDDQAVPKKDYYATTTATDTMSFLQGSGETETSPDDDADDSQTSPPLDGMDNANEEQHSESLGTGKYVRF